LHVEEVLDADGESGQRRQRPAGGVQRITPRAAARAAGSSTEMKV
jgi:hypothetical protein